MPVGPAKFDLNRCNESPLRGEKPDFWPVSKFNTGSLPLRGILPVMRKTMTCVAIAAFMSLIVSFVREDFLLGWNLEGSLVSCASEYR